MIRLHRLAEAEALDAHLHYVGRSAAAAARFQVALHAALEAVLESPARWVKDDRGFHRYKVKAFPYLVIYREEGEDVFVVAIAHGSRDPEYWKGRK